MLTPLHKLIVLGTACLLLAIASCKKDNNDVPALTGKYRVVAYPGDDTVPQYYLFNDDKTYTVLSQNNQGVKRVDKGVYTYKDPSLVLSSYYNAYVVRHSGDTIKLVSNPSAGDDSHIVLIKDNNAPAATDWVQRVNVTNRIPVPDIQPTAFTVLAGKFFTTDEYNPQIRRYNTANGQLLPALTTAANYYGITTISSSLWGMTVSGKLNRLDPATGNVVFSASGTINGYDVIAGTGTSIYCFNAGSGNMREYDVIGDVFSAQRSLQTDVRDVVYKGGYLYLANYRYIYKVDPASLRVVKSYTMDEEDGISGFGSDGTDFWVYVNDQLDAPGYFGKITLD
ncbi:MAG TPA: hypothetical protein VK154_11020 [Chitinophagales bacterium]|nr:hypothetical protein [Chitinophagales bacterium]